MSSAFAHTAGAAPPPRPPPPPSYPPPLPVVRSTSVAPAYLPPPRPVHSEVVVDVEKLRAQSGAMPEKTLEHQPPVPYVDHIDGKKGSSIHESVSVQSWRTSFQEHKSLVIGIIIFSVALAVSVVVCCSVAYGPNSATGTGSSVVIRQYYVQAEWADWDYAPGGINKITGQPFGEAERMWTAREGWRPGHQYRKILLVQYDDDGYTKRSPREPWQGLIGPVFRAAVGEKIRVTLRNSLDESTNRAFSIHPHGVFYLKNAEGAMYNDMTCMENRMDDMVLPGATYTYEWDVPDRAGPGPSDPSSIAWFYHSHVNSVFDSYAGQIGAMIITRKGQADATTAKPVDVDKEIVTIFAAMYEAETGPGVLQATFDKYMDGKKVDWKQMLADDPEILDSFLKHSINGYSYGHLPGLELRVGERNRWHVIALGTEWDMHTPRWDHGTVQAAGGRRTSEVALMPASQHSLDIYVDRPGTYIFGCGVADHITKGEQAWYTVLPALNANVTAATGPTRTYYIAADEVDWNYAPAGKDLVSGADFTAAQAPFVVKDATHVGSVYRKAVYRRYTNDTFLFRYPAPEDEFMGVLGPAIRATIGDTVRIVFKNKAGRPYGLVPDGSITVVSGPDAVAPGEVGVYVWQISERAGPGPHETSSKIWTYHSHVDTVADTYAGLLGPIVVTRVGDVKAGTTATEPSPADVDRELFALFSITDETLSGYLDASVAAAAGGSADAAAAISGAADLAAASKKYAINGYVYGNARFGMVQGERVRWYILAWGAKDAIVSAHFSGQTVIRNGQYIDVVDLMPGSATIVDMFADSPGTWLLRDDVTEHSDWGMTALFAVKQTSDPYPTFIAGTAGGAIRSYYLAIEESEWDYAPFDRDLEHVNMGNMMSIMKGDEGGAAPVAEYDPTRRALLQDDEGNPLGGTEWADKAPIYVKNFIGRKYKKARYVEYTDSSFSVPKTRGERWEHLGVQGPVLRAEVGDEIRVFLKNSAKFPFSIHPHGVFYLKNSEGIVYDDGRTETDRQKEAVQPGEIGTFRWYVPERAGPAPNGPSSTVWPYSSAVNPTSDIYAGLVGAILVNRKGASRGAVTGAEPGLEMMPKDVDREFVTLFMVDNESLSPYVTDNIATYITDKDTLAEVYNAEGGFSDDFAESNMMHGINGFVFGNLEGLTMQLGERVRWYVMSIGSEADMHSVHWHGQVGLYDGRKIDVIEMLPSTSRVVDMDADNVGKWMFHCHVNDHIEAGMLAIFEIQKNGQSLGADCPTLGQTSSSDAAPVAEFDPTRRKRERMLRRLLARDRRHAH